MKTGARFHFAVWAAFSGWKQMSDIYGGNPAVKQCGVMVRWAQTLEKHGRRVNAEHRGLRALFAAKTAGTTWAWRQAAWWRGACVMASKA